MLLKSWKCKIEQTRFHEHIQCRLNSSYLSTPFHRILSQALSHTHPKAKFYASTVSVYAERLHKFSGSAEQIMDLLWKQIQIL